MKNDEKRWRMLVAKKYFFLSRSRIADLFHYTKAYATKI